MQVPGGALDSLSSNTKLGKAVQEACDELDALVTLVRQTSKALLPLLVRSITQNTLHAPSSSAVVADDPLKAVRCIDVQERQSLTDAQDMLRKLGYKGNILQADLPQEQSQAAAQIQGILTPTERDRSIQD